MAIPIGVAVAAIAVCLAAAWYASRHPHGGRQRAGAQRALLSAVACAGRLWHEPGRVWHKTRQSARRAGQAVHADVVPADRRPFRTTPRDLLNAIRRDVATDGGGDGAETFITLATGRDVLPARLLASFAAQQGQAMASERSSLFYLASRFTGTPGEAFFAELAGTFRHAGDMLGMFAESLGARKSELRAREPLAGCQAYPAYVAWLSMNASAEDAALALAASLGTWGENLGSLATGLRKHSSFPAVGTADRASAFFDIFAAPAGRLEDQALAVVAEAQDAGRRPVHALQYARLLHGYQSMFWKTLAEQEYVANART